VPGAVALADWQYTGWGMSKADVAAASQGQAIEHRVARRESWGIYPDMAAPSRFASYQYRAFFYFDAKKGGLKAVRLDPRPGVWCPDVARALMNTYGSDQRLVDGYFVWQDRSANDKITLSNFSTCRIRYEPLLEAAD
jgi:hypothetical protein